MRVIFFILIYLFCFSASVGAENSPSFNISKYRGQIVYLDFWASWCVPCRKSFPWLNAMRDKYTNEQLAIVAVNLDKDHKLAQEFLAKYPGNFEILFDSEGSLAKKYQIPGMPSSILFDREGRVIKAQSGFFEKQIKHYELQLETAVNNRESEEKGLNE